MNQRGVALLTVLWVVFVLSLISFSLAASVGSSVGSVRYDMDSQRALWMAKGAAEVAFGIVAGNMPLSENSLVRRENGQLIFSFDAGEARVDFGRNAAFLDINGKSEELLKSALESAGVEPAVRNALIDSILDWLDTDDERRPSGAETNDYPQDGKVVFPRNGPFQSIGELLLVKNVTPDIYFGAVARNPGSGQFERRPGLRDVFGVGGGPLDVNEASLYALQAIPEMPKEVAGAIVQERGRKSFASLEDLTQRVPWLGQSSLMRYLAVGTSAPTVLAARGTVWASGVSASVKLFMKLSDKGQMMIDHWEYD